MDARPVWFAVIIWLAGFHVAACQEAPFPQLRLQYRSPGQSMLYVGHDVKEIETAEEVCRQLSLRIDVIKSLAMLPLDCSELHTIIVGSNAIDYFSPNEQEQSRQDEVFASLEEFVSRGGHLLFYGSFNGRNSKRLSYLEYAPPTFTTTSSAWCRTHRSSLRRFGKACSQIRNDSLAGQPFSIDEDRNSVVMLRRGVGDAEVYGNRSYPDGPVLATVAFRRGRVTYTSVEPGANGIWLVPIVIMDCSAHRQIATNCVESVIVPPQRLRSMNTPAIQSDDAVRRRR
ncbi:MAG: hypothetical protein R3C05_26205 [Pirellulaceae bacterium]